MCWFTKYVLRLNCDLIDRARKIEIRENGSAVFRGVLGKDGVSVKAQKGKNAFKKRPGLSGPLWDVYSSRHFRGWRQRQFPEMAPYGRV